MNNEQKTGINPKKEINLNIVDGSFCQLGLNYSIVMISLRQCIVREFKDNLVFFSTKFIFIGLTPGKSIKYNEEGSRKINGEK